ncbi:SDR family oxidoreductase [Arthrobacter zhaoguopingii]|uniref:SDR family oxidoreductase n=1 Tax=Arthrobacter zhaoguopingii TaxID=2681491 RepID=UPI001358EF2B|nr:SDR family oxidoreductase [Arthrobacter zhaoguopingii]
MRIGIAGAHGKIARELTRRLVAQGHYVTGLIRNPDHAADLRQDGADPVVLDLESATAQEVADVLTGADAVVFAAGAGPGSGVERKDTVDRAASVLLADAAELAGVGRFLQISSMGADSVDGGVRPEGMDDIFYAYLLAKLAAEQDLQARKQLSWTIVRPGGLTDEPGTGRVKLAAKTGFGSIPRADVASVLAALLVGNTGRSAVLELTSGEQTVRDAVSALA